MRFPLWMLGVTALGIACLGGACATSTSSADGADAGDSDGLDPDDDFDAGASPSTSGDPTQGAGATGSACSLSADGISFSTNACTNAMQSYCCNETQSCFYDNDDCNSLHNCVLKCVSTGGTTTTDAGTTDSGASDAGKSDAGTVTTADSGVSPLTTCENACYAQYPSQAATEQAYNACYVKSTLGACN